ncbi:polysaccharide deacetylase family protein [Algoriphagus halophilus]|uniref:Peptidoglycan/xylan/chitin deacetylase, PgdA/CDA1 family n=1 Tax=Algoriphagus halophilus TaxID=226505 RepID=A0A1N6EB81_9BACT|nr:polysaccharide deacetylase family protein [Algoriphagus halophilus]SIN80288.1 Peptidoglycan/xylan/chitin deacetylase, PgdA/CDA1 family [Algoriphagus halophilus]
MNKVWGLLLCFSCSVSFVQGQVTYDAYGALTRSDQKEKNIYLIFSGHDYQEGFEHVLSVLTKYEIKGSFFFTGEFVRSNQELVKKIAKGGHYLGAHSDQHLLYCDWGNRDSLLVDEQLIRQDIMDNLKELGNLGVHPDIFLPPYEWYNKKVVEIAKGLGQLTINFSAGTRSNADYTSPDMDNYVDSSTILESVYEYESKAGLNGFHLLIHPGTDPKREDKFYLQLEGLINGLEGKGYKFAKLSR